MAASKFFIEDSSSEAESSLSECFGLLLRPNEVTVVGVSVCALNSQSWTFGNDFPSYSNSYSVPDNPFGARA